MDNSDKHFTFNGGETFIMIPGNRYIHHVIRDKVLSKFHIKYEKDKTRITFDYPFLPRESLVVSFNESNGLQRAEEMATGNKNVDRKSVV